MHSKSHHHGAARLFSFKNVGPLAQASRLKEIECDKAAATFHRHYPENSILIKVYFASETVESRFIDPIKGPTILFQRRQTLDSLQTLFSNPRQPTGMGSWTRYGVPHAVYSEAQPLSLVPLEFYPDTEEKLVRIFQDNPIKTKGANSQHMASILKAEGGFKAFGYNKLTALLISFPEFVSVHLQHGGSSLSPVDPAANKFRFSDLSCLAAQQLPHAVETEATTSLTSSWTTSNPFNLLDISSSASSSAPSSSSAPPPSSGPPPDAPFSEEWGRSLLYSNLDMCAYYCGSLLMSHGFDINDPHFDITPEIALAVEWARILIFLCDVYRERSKNPRCVEARERYQVELQLLRTGYKYVEKAHDVLFWIDLQCGLIAGNTVGYNDTVLLVSYCLEVFGRHLEDRHAHILKVIARLEENLRRRLEERDTVRSRIPDWKNNSSPKNTYVAERLTLKEQIEEARGFEEGVKELLKGVTSLNAPKL
mgnify:CR=1 FL=1